MKPLYVPCPQCARMLTTEGCSNPTCDLGIQSGYTLPPPTFTVAPDPFPELCEKCGQPIPLPRPPSSG